MHLEAVVPNHSEELEMETKRMTTEDAKRVRHTEENTYFVTQGADQGTYHPAVVRAERFRCGPRTNAMLFL